MAKFLTMKEAAELTGKSPSSIRRIIYPILNNPRHADRSHIEPSAKKATELRVKGESFAWRVSEELLSREIPAKDDKAGTTTKRNVAGPADASAAIIEVLKGELDIKNQQIAAQNEVIKGLSERVREGNVLMGSLQQRLALTDGTSRNNHGIVDAGNSSPQTQKGSDTQPPKKPHWLFRKIF